MGNNESHMNQNGDAYIKELHSKRSAHQLMIEAVHMISGVAMSYPSGDTPIAKLEEAKVLLDKAVLRVRLERTFE